MGDPPHPSSGISLLRPEPGSATSGLILTLSGSLGGPNKYQAEDQGPGWEHWFPKTVSPGSVPGLGHLADMSVTQLTKGQARVPRLSPSHPLLPTQLFTAWLAVDSQALVGACLAGRLHPQGRDQVGLGRAAGSFPGTARAPCLQRACVHSCVCCVFVFLFHVLPLLSLIRTSLPSSAAPNVPAPGIRLPARSWRSRSAGPDLFPTHRPKVLALPCPLSSLLHEQMA